MSSNINIRRFERVSKWLEHRGYRISSGTVTFKKRDFPTVDVDRAANPEINGGWGVYNKGDDREKVIALVEAARQFMEREKE